MIKMENKIATLADTIVNHSLKLNKGERVLIIMETMEPKNLVKYLIDYIYQKEGIPSIKIINEELNSKILENLDNSTIDSIISIKNFEVNNYDCFINIRCSTNDYEQLNINKEKYKLLGQKSLEIDNIKINKRKWVLLNYPSSLDAYKAKQTTSNFIEYALDVMTVDYNKMYQDLLPLRKMMEETNNVCIIAKDTNLTFSIKNMPIIICAGESNIPDGEIYTAPIKESVNGYITYNTPSPYQGNVYNHIKLEFKNGQIIKATCDEDNTSLNEIFNSDEGARYIGEFSLGVNPKILKPMGDILYDEKIFGSIHFTPGKCYQNAYNGNASSIHWDLVLIMTSEYGGGEIYFDDNLIRKNGYFIPNELQGLNYK